MTVQRLWLNPRGSGSRVLFVPHFTCQSSIVLPTRPDVGEKIVRILDQHSFPLSSPSLPPDGTKMSETSITSNGSTISSPQPAHSPPQFRQTSSVPVTNLLPNSPQYVNRGSIPNTPLTVSAISAALGALAAGSLVAAAQPGFRLLGSGHWGWAKPQLGLYGLAMGMFHLWEFWTTAGWNPQKLSVDGESRFWISRILAAG